jgi:hypothetical protein
VRLTTWLRPEKSQSVAQGRGFESRHLHEDHRSVIGHGAAPGGTGAAPFAFDRYSFGHLSVSAAFDEAAELVEAELDVAAEDETLADGLASAAWAIAEPPPTRTPEIARVIPIRFSCCRMCLTSSCRRTSVKTSRLRDHGVCAEDRL